MPIRLGLLTLPFNKNYGGILQAAALYEYLTENGAEVVLLERARPMSRTRALATALLQVIPEDTSLGAVGRGLASAFRGVLEQSHWMSNKAHALRRYVSNERFVRNYIPVRSGRLNSSEDMRVAIGEWKLDAIVVGSDQVWRPDYVPSGSLPDFFLGFTSGTAVRCISYAASFGHSEWRYPSHTAEVAGLLSRFSAVSVREASGLAVCRDVFGRGDAVHVLDPTLLVDPSFYERVADAPIAKTGKVLFEYILDQVAGAPSIRTDLAASLSDTYLVRSVALGEESSLLSIGGWVRAVMDADFVLTDSFHGMVFSIIFKKDFIAVVNQKRGADRFTSLASLLGVEDRLVAVISGAQAREIAAQPIDYSAVSARLEVLRERSRAFLRDALTLGES